MLTASKPSIGPKRHDRREAEIVFRGSMGLEDIFAKTVDTKGAITGVPYLWIIAAGFTQSMPKADQGDVLINGIFD
jgi:hypothetical protein